MSRTGYVIAPRKGVLDVTALLQKDLCPAVMFPENPDMSSTVPDAIPVRITAFDSLAGGGAVFVYNIKLLHKFR